MAPRRRARSVAVSGNNPDERRQNHREDEEPDKGENRDHVFMVEHIGYPIHSQL